MNPWGLWEFPVDDEIVLKWLARAIELKMVVANVDDEESEWLQEMLYAWYDTKESKPM